VFEAGKPLNTYYFTPINGGLQTKPSIVEAETKEKGEKRMEETFERIARHFYKRQYQNSTGDWRTSYYALFVTWQGKRQRFSLGDCLEDARDELGRLHTLNKGRYDFNAEKENQAKAKIKAMTLAEWLDLFLDLVKSSASYKTRKSQCLPLKRLLGHLPLSEINRFASWNTRTDGLVNR
jgi:hypothetical protein